RSRHRGARAAEHRRGAGRRGVRDAAVGCRCRRRGHRSEALQAMSMLSVVIVGFNKARWTARCLGSLLDATYRPLQLVVVNNGSTDATAEVLAAFAGAAAEADIELTTLAFPKNLGSIASRNIAFRRCKGDYIALLDNDT